MTPHELPRLSDDELLSELREAFNRVDPAPTDLVDRARRAFGWDAALAVLTEVVSTSRPQPVLRSVDTPVTFSFELDEVEAQVDLEAGADETITIIGHVKPTPRRIAAIESSGVAIDVEVDDRGRFVFVTRADAVVLQFEFAGGHRVRTPSIDVTTPPP